MVPVVKELVPDCSNDPPEAASYQSMVSFNPADADTVTCPVPQV